MLDGFVHHVYYIVFLEDMTDIQEISLSIKLVEGSVFLIGNHTIFGVNS